MPEPGTPEWWSNASDKPFTVGELRDTMRKLLDGQEIFVWNRYAGLPERFVLAETEMFGRHLALLWPIGISADGSPLSDQEILCPKCRGEMQWTVTYRGSEITGAKWVHIEETDCDV